MSRFVLMAAVIAGISLVSSPLNAANASQIVTNGGFENGQSGWAGSRSGLPHLFITTGDHHAGTHSAALCGIARCGDVLVGTVSVPSTMGKATLSLWTHSVTPGATARSCSSRLTVQFRVPQSRTPIAPAAVCSDPDTGWTQLSEDVTAELQRYVGQVLQLRVSGHTNALQKTTFFIDDVQVQITSPIVPPASSTQISADPFGQSSVGQHSTEVEPSAFSHGTTLVTGFQVGRIYNGGSAAMGWATFANGSWTHGLLPGITTAQTPAGPYDRVTDAAIAYDAAHHMWLANSLGLTAGNSDVRGAAVLVNRSPDGLTWSSPIILASSTFADFDKNWITCDDTVSSPYYGHCYVEWDDYGNNDAVLLSTSSDGGLTWSAPVTPQGGPVGLGGQPLVQPNGTVIVPFADAYEGAIDAVVSSDGGKSWSWPQQDAPVSGIDFQPDPGSIRSAPLPSAAMDSSGKIYVVWADCRFESSCGANDLVMTTSSNGTTWSPLMRIPTHTVDSGQDSFVGALAVNSATGGGTAQLALTYYYFQNSACGISTCKLNTGFISSTNGGLSWSVPKRLAGPISTGWLANTSQGVMTGDYIATSFVGGVATSVFADAAAGSAGNGYSEWIAATRNQVTGGHAAALPVSLRTGRHDTTGVVADARPRKRSP